MKSFDHKAIESKWKAYWQENQVNQVDLDTTKETYYCLDMFPYPSGDGLHVGHWRGYVLSDVLARFARLHNKEVLHPMGYDSFGLPAENAAIKGNRTPQEYTKSAIENYSRQLDEMGSMYDWSKTVTTSSPEYYRWTQWLFLLLYNNGLAYQKEAKVNWCPNDQTVLANEQVTDGVCERCGGMIIRKNLKQWYFKITDYSEELLTDLDKLQWPDVVKTLQKNWIGKSTGATIELTINNTNFKLPIFTTRLDTIMGMTYVAVAPELPWLDEALSDDKKLQLKTYRDSVASMSDIDRQVAHDKTGFDSGLTVAHPFTNESIPVWITDYVLADYGTGAVMSVPAHDERDFEFANKFNLPIKTVIAPTKEETAFEAKDQAYLEKGYLINSGEFSGLSSADSVIKMIDQSHGTIQTTTQFRMRDWLVSRQRYWGAPIPIIHCPACGVVPVPESQLPVELPILEDFKPKGESPLASSEEFVNTQCPTCHGDAKRETDTLDTFVDSSWYFLRYLDPANASAIFTPERVNKWLPVDQYIGGIEHATKHLLYSRFITKVLADQKLIDFREPFTKLFGIGLIYMQGSKMSKSKGNVINPDELVKYYGTDALRGYEMFIGPNDQFAEWSPSGINGIYRFLVKLHQLLTKPLLPTTAKSVDQFVNEYTALLESGKTNTAIATAMKAMRDWEKDGLTKDNAEKVLIVLSPIFPFLCEQLWEQIGNQPSIFNATWPELVANEQTTQELPVQINSKVKFMLKVSLDINQEELAEQAVNEAQSQQLITSDTVKKVIAVPGRIVNIIV